MKRAWPALGGLLLGLLIAGCGGGERAGNGEDADSVADSAAIDALARELGEALEARDLNRLAALFSEDCGDLTGTIEASLAATESLDIQVSVTGTDIQNLTQDSAALLVLGIISVDGDESRLEDDNDYLPVSKEDGAWKLGDCAFFG
jgi:hypothetical protein